MTKHEIEFRTQQPEPTEAGYYYGRPKIIAGGEVVPIMVRQHSDGLRLEIPGSPNTYTLDWCVWFGPVREVRESKFDGAVSKTA